MAIKAIVTKEDKTKDKIWKDVAPAPPRRPEDLPDPKPQKSKSKASKTSKILKTSTI